MSYEYKRRITPKVNELRRKEQALSEALEQIRRELANELLPRGFGLQVGEIHPCGTYGAYQRHRRHGEKPCAKCKEAYNSYLSEYRTSRAKGPGRKVQPCGTYAAYYRHIRKGEKPCEACKAANTIYYREKRHKKATAAPVEPSRKRQNAA